MINKRIKSAILRLHKDNNRIGFSLGTLALIIGCAFLLMIATFTQIKTDIHLPENTLSTYLKLEYIPQIPVVLFIGALLGECWGLFAVLLYILMGLSPMFPVFGLGGGLSYIFQYSFGYIFAYIFAVLIAAKQIKRKNTIFNKFLAVVYGISIVHVIGAVYMAVLAMIRHESFDYIVNWIYFQSISKLIYDIVFGFLAVLLASGIRKVFWLLLN